MANNDGDLNPPGDYNVMPDLGEFDGKKVVVYIICLLVIFWLFIILFVLVLFT